MNYSKYNYNDFTENHYKEILKLAKSKYCIENYNTFLVTANKSWVIWRHDVDFSMQRAYSLAKIEYNEKLNSTFFIQIGSIFYNIFENSIKEKVFKILELGHQIGLHFDLSNYKIDSIAELNKYLLFEKQILEQLFRIEINAFSFHNPTSDILKYEDLKYCNMINTYSDYFKNNIGYCSDSNGYWRHERLEDFIKTTTYSKIQILTHPVWWQKEIMSPRDRVWRSIEFRGERAKQYYNKFLDEGGRENIK